MDRCADKILLRVDDINVQEIHVQSHPLHDIELVDLGNPHSFEDIDIHIVVEDETKAEFSLVSVKSLGLITLISLLLHMLTIGLMKHFMTPFPEIAKADDITPIQAQLWFPSAEKKPPLVSETTPAPPDIETPKTQPEKAPETVQTAESSPSPTPSEPAEPVPVPKVQPPITQTTPKPQSSLSTTPTNNDHIDWSVLGANSSISKHLDNINATQQESILNDAVSNRAIRQYQQSLPDPQILAERAEAKLRPTKKVNCSNNMAKSLAILSTITGGTLKCTDTPDANTFIDARLGKSESK